MENRNEQRLVKFPLQLSLIREIDQAIVSGVGGYTTRAEFFRDAAESLLAELRYKPAPAEPIIKMSSKDSDQDSETHNIMGHQKTGEVVLASNDLHHLELRGLQDTALHFVCNGKVITNGEAEISNEPLFGIHNRDFPSLWVASRLAEKSAAGPVPYSSFIDTVTEEAWEYADMLHVLESQTGKKLTALFPTNKIKPQSARGAFRAFAVGTVVKTKDQQVQAYGPLFTWKVCQIVQASASDVLIGLTAHGQQLLCALEGITLALPHAQQQGRIFLDYLRQYASADWKAFLVVLEVISERPTRTEVIDKYQAVWPDWSANVATTNAQGYIARAREWGLVKEQQESGRYVLTEFGVDYLGDSENGSALASTTEVGR